MTDPIPKPQQNPTAFSYYLPIVGLKEKPSVLVSIKRWFVEEIVCAPWRMQRLARAEFSMEERVPWPIEWATLAWLTVLSTIYFGIQAFLKCVWHALASIVLVCVGKLSYIPVADCEFKTVENENGK